MINDFTFEIDYCHQCKSNQYPSDGCPKNRFNLNQLHGLQLSKMKLTASQNWYDNTYVLDLVERCPDSVARAEGHSVAVRFSQYRKSYHQSLHKDYETYDGRQKNQLQKVSWKQFQKENWKGLTKIIQLSSPLSCENAGDRLR